jgi:DNA-binding response OmpR family regulator
MVDTPDGTGQRILVIDDDVAIRVLLQAVLKRINFEVDLAEDGEVALEKLRVRPYDLILLDLMMPRVNGYEFLDRLEQRDSVRRPHIIVFTAAGQRGIDKLPPNSVCDAILKPFDLESFLALIAKCMNGDHTKSAPSASARETQ